MTAVVQPQTPRPPRVSLANVVLANNGGDRIVYMSRDRATTFFIKAGLLKKSTDDGTTKTTIYTDAGSANVRGVLELPNGQLLLTTQTIGTQVGRIYKSAGYPGATTWTLKHTTISQEIRPFWGLHDSCIDPATGNIYVSEYGAQTHASADDTRAARRIWKSTDNAETFTQIFDLVTYAAAHGLATQASRAGIHVHAVAWDSIDSRLWFTFGDGTGAGPAAAGGGQNAQIGYTDDDFTTVNFVTVPTTLGTGARAGQSVSIRPLENAIVFQTDGLPNAILVLPRTGFRTYGPLVVGPVMGGNTGNTALGYSFFRAYNRPDLPCFAAITSSSAAVRAGLMASVDGGLRWDELYREAVGTLAWQGVVGPTVNGKILAYSSYTGPSSTWSQGTNFMADLVMN